MVWNALAQVILKQKKVSEECVKRGFLDPSFKTMNSMLHRHNCGYFLLFLFHL